jgi:low temperature requirement protein LtrA
MLLGIVMLSAGVKKTVGHAFEPLAWAPAVALGTGTALFLLGHAWFLRVLRIPGVRRAGNTAVHTFGRTVCGPPDDAT